MVGKLSNLRYLYKQPKDNVLLEFELVYIAELTRGFIIPLVIIVFSNNIKISMHKMFSEVVV